MPGSRAFRRSGTSSSSTSICSIRRPLATGLAIVALASLTFAPIVFVHPFRVVKLRSLTLILLLIWSVLGFYAVMCRMAPDALGGLDLVRHRRVFPRAGLFPHEALPWEGAAGHMIELLTDPRPGWRSSRSRRWRSSSASTTSSSSRCSSSKLPEAEARRARSIGLSLALVFRIIMLLGLTWLIGLTEPLFTLFEPRLFLARPDPDRRRAVPPVQGDARDPYRIRA